MDLASTLGASIPVFQKLEPATVSPLKVLGLSVLVVVALLVLFFGPELWRRAPRPTTGAKLQPLPIRSARELGRRTARPSA